jgi:hypothetical protein
VIVDVFSSGTAERAIFVNTLVASYFDQVESVRNEAANVLSLTSIASLCSNHLAHIEILVVTALKRMSAFYTVASSVSSTSLVVND